MNECQTDIDGQKLMKHCHSHMPIVKRRGQNVKMFQCCQNQMMDCSKALDNWCIKKLAPALSYYQKTVQCYTCFFFIKIGSLKSIS